MRGVACLVCEPGSYCATNAREQPAHILTMHAKQAAPCASLCTPTPQRHCDRVTRGTLAALHALLVTQRSISHQHETPYLIKTGALRASMRMRFRAAKRAILAFIASQLRALRKTLFHYHLLYKQRRKLHNLQHKRRKKKKIYQQYSYNNMTIKRKKKKEERRNSSGTGMAKR